MTVQPERKSLEPYFRDDVVLRDYQLEGVRWIASRRSCIIADDMGLGKGQVLSAPVLTPSGWTQMKDLAVGSEVIGSDGAATEITGIFPRGVLPVYRVTFSDGSSELFDEDHLWAVNSPVRKARGSAHVVKSTRELVDGGLRDAAGNRKWYIPMVEPVTFEVGEELTIDPYTIGAILGDGAVSQHSVTLTTDREIAESLTLPAGVECRIRDIPVGKYEADYIAIAGLVGMVPHLRELGMMGKRSESKSIPHRYLWAPRPEQRIALLQGLLDTDGTPVASRGNKRTTIEYGTVSAQLAADVKFIVQSLGGTASIQEKVPTYHYKGEKKEGQVYYRMVLSLPSAVTPFRLARKLARWTPRSKYEPTRGIESIEYSHDEPVQCISVAADDSLYVTTDFIVTHNTIQALAAMCIDIKHGFAERICIVCPPSLKGNWAEEIMKFTRLDFYVVKGGPQKRVKQMLAYKNATGPRVLIVNYEQIVGSLVTMHDMNFHITAYDEAHYLKNPLAQRTIASVDMPTLRSFMLTGTPVLNSIDELWPLLYKVDPVEWPSLPEFLDRYAVYGGYGGNQIVGVRNEEELRARLAPYMIRREKSLVLDLKEPQVIPRYVDMYDAQEKMYRRALDEMVIELDDGTQEEIENSLTQFLRLKQISNTTYPFAEKDVSAKLDLAVDDAKIIAANGWKSVIFTQFTDTFTVVADRLRKAGLTVHELSVAVKPDERAAFVSNWGAQPTPDVLLCSTHIAGVGLNMTQARHCLFIDKLFVPGLNKQAVDRLHRLGQDETQPVQVFEYFSRGTVEEKIERILQRKQTVIGSVVQPTSELREALIEALQEEGVTIERAA